VGRTRGALPRDKLGRTLQASREADHETNSDRPRAAGDYWHRLCGLRLLLSDRHGRIFVAIFAVLRRDLSNHSRAYARR
jgi:hypothetical protein